MNAQVLEAQPMPYWKRRDELARLRERYAEIRVKIGKLTDEELLEADSIEERFAALGVKK